MAKTTTAPNTETETIRDPMDDKIVLTLPRATGKEESELFVGLNGKGYRIKKGVPVSVPRPVYDIVMESELARRKQEEFREARRAR